MSTTTNEGSTTNKQLDEDRAMARALTAQEDILEVEASRRAENLAARSELRRVRRVIEDRMA